MTTVSYRSQATATLSDLDHIETFAIGDVHGRSDLLGPLLDTVGQNARSSRYRIVFLGDLIDRGPSSRAVLHLAQRTLAELPESRLLIGNHEEFLLRFLERPQDIARFRTWMDNGGVETLRSFGVTSLADREAVANLLRSDSESMEVLSKGIDLAVMGQIVFAHAGIRPGTPIDEQSTFDVRWIREAFLDFAAPLPWIVVHGHTPTDTGMPEVTRSRVNLDTGAFATGSLFALRVPTGSEPVSFLFARETEEGIVVGEW
jgi:serine/threonine protein phosphatase 1